MSQIEMPSGEIIEAHSQKVDVKNTRIRAFDFARGIAIIAMVVIHVIVFLGDPELEETIWAFLANVVICMIAAPVFSFIMGIMMGMSSKKSSKQLIYRGLVILLIGYILNIFRGIIPVTIAEWFEWENASWEGENILSYLFEMDILQFAGFAFISIALLKKVIPSNIGLAIAGIIIVFIPSFLQEINIYNQAVFYVFSMLFGGNSNVYFPLFPWLVFPLVGIFYGSALKKAENKNKFFASSFYIGLILIVCGFIVVFLNPGDIFEEWIYGEFRQKSLPPAVSIIFLGFQGVWLPICYFISENIREGRIVRAIYFWSKNVTAFYVIQWILIGWFVETFPYLSLSGIILTVLMILFVTDRVAKFWLYTKKNLAT